MLCERAFLNWLFVNANMSVNMKTMDSSRDEIDAEAGEEEEGEMIKTVLEELATALSFPFPPLSL